MLSIFSKKTRFFFIAIIPSLIIALAFNIAIPHKWADTYQAREYISMVSKFVPAMVELRNTLPSENNYIALTGAVVWGGIPIWFLVVLLVSNFDKYFIFELKKSSSNLKIKSRNSIIGFLWLIVINSIVIRMIFFTMWKSTHQYGPGFLMNMINPGAVNQIITWVCIGTFEFSLLWINACFFRVILYKIKERIDAQ